MLILAQNVNAPQPSEPVTLSLKILTIVGSILSMVGLVLTILTMLIFKYVVFIYSDLLLIYCKLWANRKLRKRDASKFNIQLCLAMFLMLLSFVIGVERTENTIGCTIASVLIQYFTLASVFWMGAEAVLMFKKLIIVFGRISTTFIVAVSVICWGMYKHIIV